MLHNLIIINGYPRSGKDTFIDYCSNELLVSNSFVKHSTIDTIKEVAKSLGWNGEKTPEMRMFLSELKDLYTKYMDGPLNEIKEKTYEFEYVFTCMREPTEIEKTVAWCKENEVNCCTVLVRGSNEEIDHQSHSDAMVLKYDYDTIMLNYGSLNDLEEMAQHFMLTNMK